MKLRIASLIAALALAGSTVAATVAGIAVPDSATVAGQNLVLNGAGLRKKAIFKVYVGALYLPSKTTSDQAALAQTGAAKVTMKMMRDVEAEKLRAAWSEGFANNSPPADMPKLKDRIARFNALFADTEEGDLIEVDLNGAAGATVTINGKARGTVEGEDFAKAVLRIWLGPKPPSDDLKNGMLGKG
jgi:long-chain acyl-CoA synthetase